MPMNINVSVTDSNGTNIPKKCEGQPMTERRGIFITATGCHDCHFMVDMYFETGGENRLCYCLHKNGPKFSVDKYIHDKTHHFACPLYKLPLNYLDCPNDCKLKTLRSQEAKE